MSCNSNVNINYVLYLLEIYVYFNYIYKSFFYSCQNTEGSYICVCPHGLVGDPIQAGCKQPGDCFADSDCPATAACVDNRCTNPCDTSTTCGKNAKCFARGHVPICQCPDQTTGDPSVSFD